MNQTKISKMELLDAEPYFDFHVPVFNNYWAEGMWHHNTGKSMVAKAVAAVFGLPLVRLDMGSIYGSLVGQSEQNARTALRAADAMSPCVVWLDEIEKAFAGAGGSSGDSGTSERVFGTFLTWMAERPIDKPAFVVATSNDLSNLPPELLRKGRFSEIFFVDLPDTNERTAILNIHLRKANIGVALEHEISLDPEDVAAVVAEMEGFVGAEIEEALNEARVAAFADDVEFSKGHLIAAVRATTPLSVTRKETIDGMRRWAMGRARHASVLQEAHTQPSEVTTDRALRGEFELQ